MATTYKNMVKRLSRKYPEKHLFIIGNKPIYYPHDGGYFTKEYAVYVEEVDCKFNLSTHAQVEKYVDFLCSKEG